MLIIEAKSLLGEVEAVSQVSSFLSNQTTPFTANTDLLLNWSPRQSQCPTEQMQGSPITGLSPSFFQAGCT